MHQAISAHQWQRSLYQKDCAFAWYSYLNTKWRRDYTFLSQFWQEGTTLKFIAAYHLKSDGKTEVLNRTLKTYLRFYTLTNPNNGHIFFHGQSTGTTPDFKLQRTPFEILCGRYPPSLTCFNLGDTLVDSVALDLIARDEALHQLK
jgi:hypothetical protein